MAIKDSSVYGSNNLYLVKESKELKAQLGIKIEKIILAFINNPPNSPVRRFTIAYNQILSLYRRRRYHPEKKVLCKFYENRIKQIIQLEKGNEK